MDMDGDESFVFDTLKLSKITCGLLNKSIEQVKELLICRWHYLFVAPCIAQSIFCITCPDHLNPEKGHLKKGGNGRESQ